MTPKQKALIVEALEQAADTAQNAMLHAKCALIDLKYDDPDHAASRAVSIFQEASKAQHAATRAGAWLDYVTRPGDEN